MEERQQLEQILWDLINGYARSPVGDTEAVTRAANKIEELCRKPARTNI